MHGLVNRAIQCFLRDTGGEETWARVAREAGLGHEDYEPMLIYPDAQTGAVMRAAAAVLGRSATTIREDIGAYLVTHETCAPVRRLLRFGGADFPAFLASLEDLPDRARLALPELALPAITVREASGGAVLIRCAPGLDGFADVLLGLLRAVADDYGTLALIDRESPGAAGGGALSVRIVDAEFADARAFTLAGGAA